jgi:hypothetical protein
MIKINIKIKLNQIIRYKIKMERIIEYILLNI